MTERILLKTTIGPLEDDWNIDRFPLVGSHLAKLKNESGAALYLVTAANRAESTSGDDADLKALAGGSYDQLWLIAVDVTGTLTATDVQHIGTFRARGGGIFLTRDHQDLGACLTRLGAPGATQYFHTVNPEPDPKRRCCDDLATPSISWPNYRSGANGDLQRIEVTVPLHPLMRRASGEPICCLPAHPHEGAVGVPNELEPVARVVARGRSKSTGIGFNLCVAVDEPSFGRAVSDSSFHHLCDYNWDPRMGCPSFVNEPPGDEVLRDPGALGDVYSYVENVAAWLGRRI